MARTFKDLQGVRIRQAIDGPDFSDPDQVHHLPAGQEGTVVHVFPDNAAYEVEFIVGEPDADGVVEHPRFCLVALEPHQLEAVH